MLRLRPRALGYAYATLALLGCTNDPSPSSDTGSSTGDASSGSTSLDASSNPGSATSATGGPSDDTLGTTTLTTLTSSLDEAFMGIPDFGSAQPCDVFAQDCPRGTKCMPAFDDRGFLGEWHCTTIADDPAGIGDPCHADAPEPPSADDCELGSICWDVSPATLEGTCLPLCVGTPERPSCADPNHICQIGEDGIVPVCHAACDPLLQDCPDAEACYPEWDCAPDASGDTGAYGEPCDAIDECDPGLACLDPNTVPPGLPCEDAAGCCTPYCDFSDPSASLECPGAVDGQTCLPWYPPGEAPAGFEDVGVCSLWP